MPKRDRRLETEHDPVDAYASEEEAAATQLPLGTDPMLFSGRTPRLLILSPEDGCWEVELSQPRFVIGRLGSCDLNLNLPSISRQHASICREEGSWILRDLGSSSGTTINGQRLAPSQRRLLRHLDTIQLSRVVMQFRRDERRLRSEGPQAMSFLALPSTVQVRLRRVHEKPADVFDPGDTLPIGQHGGGFSLLLPSDNNVDDCRSVIEIELTYPDRRQLHMLAEPIIAYPAGHGSLICLKLHRLDREEHNDVVRGAKRDPWIQALDLES